MTFSAAAIAAFSEACAQASATALVAGDLDILSTGGAVLASIDLGTPTSSGATTTMGGFPKSVAASGNGTAASARYRRSNGTDWKTGMTVGLAGSGAQVILSSLSFSDGQTVLINSATLAHTPA